VQAGDFSWQSLAATPQRLLAAIVIVVVALLLARELVATVGTLRDAPDIGAGTPIQATGERNFAATITAANLFGAGPATSAGEGEAAPQQTSLQLVLRGVFTSADPAGGSAIIENSDGNTRIVRAGSAVMDDILLERVYPERVVLSRNGLQESLYFPTADAALATVSPLPDQPSATEPEPGALTEEDKRANILRRLEELRERSLERNQG
jgi:general secretion pathway protein C